MSQEKLHVQEQRLGYALKRAQHALRLYMDKRLESLAISTPQYNVLAAIEQAPGSSNAALARGAFVTAQSMVGTIATLESAGLLRRRPDPHHGRVRKIELTAKGRQLLTQAHLVLANVEQQMTRGLETSQAAAFFEFLERCAANLTVE